MNAPIRMGVIQLTNRRIGIESDLQAELAELADAHVSGACGRKSIRVQVPGSAQSDRYLDDGGPMFVGHLGVGLAMKKADQRINLGLLFFAAMLLDVLLWIFVLLGIERVIIPPNFSALHYLTFSFPYSHSLVGALAWTGLAFGIVKYVLFRKKDWSARAATILAIVVFSHFVLDFLSHVPDLPIAGDSFKIGFGLNTNIWVEFAVEVLLAAIGLVVYRRSDKRTNRLAWYGLIALMTLLSALTALGAMSSIAPVPTQAAISGLVMIPLVSLIAFWLDRKPV